MSVPPDRAAFIRSVGLDFVLTLLTCGLYNIYVQYKQMQAVNGALGHEKYQFLTWALLSLITCGLYHIYHEFRFSEDVARINNEVDSDLPLVSLVLSVFGLSIVADAIQQGKINAYYGSHKL